MTLLSPRENPDLFGHEAAEAMLAQALQGARMHHAWLLTGPSGIGKATLAFRFARHVLDQNGGHQGLAVPPDRPVFRRVAAAGHADLLTIERAYDDKKKRVRSEIVVDDARAAADFLRLTPAEGGWRVVIVDGAEFMNRNAANALLKILEEPPRRALLLLVSAAPGRLLPTIRSRCRRLRLSALPEADVRRVIDAMLPDTPPDDQRALIDLANGSPGRCLALAEGEGLAVARQVERVMAVAPDQLMQGAHATADVVMKSEGGFAIFMDVLRTRIASGVRQSVTGAADGFDRIRSLEAWTALWHALTALQTETDRFNLDKRQALISALALLGGS